MRVLYHNRKRAPQLEAALGAEPCEFDALLHESDYVVMSAPLTAETRGCVVTLKAGRPWAAGVDVFEVEPSPHDNPLFSLLNFVATPHVGSATLTPRPYPASKEAGYVSFVSKAACSCTFPAPPYTPRHYVLYTRHSHAPPSTS